jgi:hypothetical protein
VLDWRLGLDVISLLLDPQFRAGLDGNFQSPGLRDWNDLAQQYADEIVELQGNAAKNLIGGIQIVQVGPRKWAAVVHPFWDWNTVLELKPDIAEFQQRNGRVKPATSFDLARRLVSTVEKCRSDS